MADDGAWALFGGSSGDQRSSETPETPPAGGPAADDGWGLFGGGAAESVATAASQDSSKRPRPQTATQRLVTVARAHVLALVNKTGATTVADLKEQPGAGPALGSGLGDEIEALRLAAAAGSARGGLECGPAAKLADDAWAMFVSAGAWTHAAERELFCLASAIAAVAALSALVWPTEAGEAEEEEAAAAAAVVDADGVGLGVAADAMRRVDVAIILGLPAAAAQSLANATESGDGPAAAWPLVGAEPAMEGTPVASIDAADLTLDSFVANHYGPDQPLVIRGLAGDWPAVTAWGGPAGIRELARQHGHRTVPVEIRDASGDLTERLMTLAEFVDQHLLAATSDASTQEDASLVPDGRSTAYVAQHDLFGQIPALGDAVETPELVEAGALSTVSAWLGTGGTVTRAHFDSMDNIFLQLSGRKYVRLLAPDQREFLYCAPKATAASAAEPSTYQDTLLAQGNMSAAPSLEGPVDMDRFPLLAEATFTEAVLGPGDALFIPAGWWHYVRSLSTSFSVNYWF